MNKIIVLQVIFGLIGAVGSCVFPFNMLTTETADWINIISRKRSESQNIVKQSEANPKIVKQSEANPKIVKQSEANLKIVKQSEANPKIVKQSEANPKIVKQSEANHKIANTKIKRKTICLGE